MNSNNNHNNNKSIVLKRAELNETGLIENETKRFIIKIPHKTHVTHLTKKNGYLMNTLQFVVRLQLEYFIDHA